MSSNASERAKEFLIGRAMKGEQAGASTGGREV
jgi:hypothetical protein